MLRLFFLLGSGQLERRGSRGVRLLLLRDYGALKGNFISSIVSGLNPLALLQEPKGELEVFSRTIEHLLQIKQAQERVLRVR
jgi:hypothetical protein